MADILQNVTSIILAATALLTLYEFLRKGGRERGEIALMFASLALSTFITLVGGLTGFENPYLTFVGVAGLCAHPFLMVRLVNQFRAVPRALEYGMFVGMLASWGLLAYLTLVLADVPAADRPVWPTLVVIGYFVVGELYAAYGLVSGAFSSTGVARRRLTFAAAGTGLLGLLLLIAGAVALVPAWKAANDAAREAGITTPYLLATQLLAFACIGSFYLGFSPPGWLRRSWRLNELESFLKATANRSVGERADQGVERIGQVALLLANGRSSHVVVRKSPQWTSRRLEPGAALSRPVAMPAEGGALAAVFASGAARLLRSEAAMEPADRALAEGARALLVVPIATRERTWGAVAIALDRVPLFVDEAIDVLGILGDQVGLFLETEAYAREQEELRVREMRLAGEELRRQHEATREANRLKSEFLANMSHELRTPLNSIIGFAELMHSGKVGEPQPTHKEFLGDILLSSRHLLQLINDVLDLAKVEAGRMEFQPEDAEVGRLVEEVNVVVRPLAARKRIAIAVERDPSVDHVSIDPVRFKQVLFNYLSNAIKFTPDEGRITVRLRPEGERMFRVEVEDTGIGIRPEDVPKLFREFQQLDASMTKQHQGTGLGLALTKKLVEAQGGTVGVRSAPGQGSVFHVILPRVGVAGSVAGRAAPVTGAGASSVLVVEDDPAEAERFAAALRAEGYDVDVAATGRQALAKLAERRYDAVTLDLILPDIHGYDVLRAVRSREEDRDVTVVIVTVLGKDEVRAAYPVEDVLQKPVDGPALAETLRRAGVEPGTSRPVLVVDDDAPIRKLMETHLKGLGYRSATAKDGKEGLERAHREPPAAVVLDLMMPRMDGFEFLERFRATREGQHVPIIVWTNKDLSADERARLEGRAQMVLSKGEGGSLELVNRLQAMLAREEA